MGRVSNFNQSIIWHNHMKDHVEMDYSTMFDAFMLNRDQGMDLKTWFKSLTYVSKSGDIVPKTTQTLKIILYFCENCKTRPIIDYFEITEGKISKFKYICFWRTLSRNYRHLYWFWTMISVQRKSIKFGQIDWLTFEIRPSSLRNLEMAYEMIKTVGMFYSGQVQS